MASPRYFLLLIFAAGFVSGSQICFENLGCYNNLPPYDNADGKLPIKYTNKHELFTSTSRNEPEMLHYQYNPARDLQGVNVRLPLTVIIHGFSSDSSVQWMINMKNKLLQHNPRQNIYLVGWPRAAGLPDYQQAVANLRLVAAEVHLIIQQFVDLGLSLDNVHLIGHSLGSHLAGEVGKRFGGNVGRISGLDPASPSFDDLPAIVRLDKSDAKFVDVIHTDARDGSEEDSYVTKALCGGFGSFQPAGHLDVYVNEGRFQPGCPQITKTACRWIGHGYSYFSFSFTCSHGRAHDYFIESIGTSCPFTVYKCSNYSQLDSGRCLECPREGCNVLGYGSTPSKQQGVTYVKTAGQSPFCSYHYGVALTPRNSTSGSLSVFVEGTNGNTPVRQMASSSLVEGQGLSGVVLSSKDVGQIQAINIGYSRSWFPWFGEYTVRVSDVTVRRGVRGEQFKSCPNTFGVDTGVPRDVLLSSNANC